MGNAKDDIKIEPLSDPSVLSEEFCKKHGLDEETQKAVTEYLAKNFFKSTPSTLSPFTTFDKLSLSSSNKSPISRYLKKTSGKTEKIPTQEISQKLYAKAKSVLKVVQKSSSKSESPERPKSSTRASVLMENIRSSKQRLEERKKIQMRENMKECSFKPDINDRSATQRDGSKQRSIKLYEDYKLKQEKLMNKSQIILKKQCPFTPNIINSGLGKINVSKTIERLNRYNEDVQNNLEKIRAVNRKLQEYDPETGQKYFQPQVSKNKHEKREKSVWEELYLKSKKKTEFIEPSKKLLIDKNSQKINEKIRYKQFSKIFKDLASDKKEISFFDIKFEEIDPQMSQILQPLFQEMADKSVSLSFEDFCSALDSLFKFLTPQEKSYLLFTYSPLSQPERK